MNDTASGKKTKPRRCLRLLRRLTVWLGVLWLICTLGFAAYAMVVNARGDAAVRHIRLMLSERDLLDRYPNAIEPELDEDGYPRDETGTSAAYWRAAMHALPDAADRPLPVVATVALAPFEPRQQYHPDTIQALREVVAHNDLFYQLVEQARQTEPGPFIAQDPIKAYEGDPYMLGQARSVARWMQVRAILAQVEGDGDTFVRALTAVQQLAHSLDDNPTLLNILVSASLDALAQHAIFVSGLSRFELNPEQLDALIDALEQRQAFYDLTGLIGLVISGEFHFITSGVQQRITYIDARQTIALEGIDPELRDMFGVTEQGLIERLWRDALLRYCPGRYELQHTKYMDQAIQLYDVLAKHQNQPGTGYDAARRLHEQFEVENEGDDKNAFNPRSLYFSLWPTVRTLTTINDRLAIAIAALQIERYRIENGRWPAKLEDAVGDAPVLDVHGQALKYQQNQEGIIVYSVGPNGIDEQGYGQYDNDAPDQYRDADDIAIRLYHPDLRNALPPPENAILPEDESEDWFDALDELLLKEEE